MLKCNIYCILSITFCVVYLKKKNAKLLGVQRYGQNCIVISERERNVLFNDALNTFYLRLYGVRHTVKDHSDSEK